MTYPTTSAGPLQDVPRGELERVIRGLRAMGLAPRQILEDAALRTWDGGSTERVPATFLAAVLERAGAACGDRQIGLHVAARAPFSHWLAYVTESQGTLAQGIETICRFQELLFGSRPLRLCRDRSALLFQPEPDPDAMRHVVEFYVATLCLQIRAWTGIEARPREVAFAHPAEGPIDEYRGLLAPRVVFGGELTVIELDPVLLSMALPRAHEQIARSLEQMACDELQKFVAPGVGGRARRLLRSAMVAGERVDSRTVARRLGVSVRTLQRRLASEGQTFRALVDEVRTDLAPPAARRRVAALRVSSPALPSSR